MLFNFLVLFSIYDASFASIPYKGLVLLQSNDNIANKKIFNLTLGGQVEFRRFLHDALHDCSQTNWGPSSFNCPRKAYLNQFTHACCDENNIFINLKINSVTLGYEQGLKILELLNLRIDDGFQFDSDIIASDQMILIASFRGQSPSTFLRVFNEDEYPMLKHVISSYKSNCLLDNTVNTISNPCPRVYSQIGIKFCCDFDDKLLSLRLGDMNLTQSDVEQLVAAMSGDDYN